MVHAEVIDVGGSVIIAVLIAGFCRNRGWSSAIPLLVAGIAVGLGRIPNSLINLPSREYWLAPERRESTVEFMSRHMLWFGSATLLLLLDMLRQTFRVHLGKTQSLEHPMLSLLGYLMFTGVWCIALVMRFLSPRNPQAGGTRPA